MGKQARLGNITDKNVGQVRKLNEVVLPVRYSDKFYKDLPSHSEHTQLAYYNNEVLVGAIGARKEPGEDGKSKLYIMTLCVLAPYRGRGIGRQLLEYVLEKVDASSDIDEVYLHVQVNNDAAVSFYDKFGFVIKETVPGYYKRLTPSDCYILSRATPAAAAE